jgi:uncharacterized damage-inducible protein DinB
MGLLDPLLQELEVEGQTTLKLLERVPDDKLGWKPHEKSMSLGVLALHVATTPGMIAEWLSAPGFNFNPDEAHEPASAKSNAELIDAFRTSNATAKNIVSKMDDATAIGVWKATVKGKEILALPRVAAFRSLLMNHTIHHRGQLSVYLRLLNIPVPSIYGPSADDNPFV